MSDKISWKILPARDKKKSFIFIVTVFGFTVLVYFVAGFYWALFSLVVLLASLFQFYTPTEYILDNDGITIKRPLYTMKKSWSEFRRVVETKSGIFLSPFSRPSRLDSFRGVHLLTQNNKKHEVIEFIKMKIHHDYQGKD